MQTGQIISNIVVGGIQFTSTVSRSGEGQISQIVVIPAGHAGAISAAGVDGLTTGHAIAGASVIDVHWTAGGVAKCRRGLTVDSTATNAITFDETPAGAGDALPAENTAVVVSVQVVVDVALDPDQIMLIAAKTSSVGMVDFRTASASILALSTIAGEAWSWASDQGVANPLTGDPMATAIVSNGAVIANTFHLGLLYDSV